MDVDQYNRTTAWIMNQDEASIVGKRISEIVAKYSAEVKRPVPTSEFLALMKAEGGYDVILDDEEYIFVRD